MKGKQNGSKRLQETKKSPVETRKEKAARRIPADRARVYKAVLRRFWNNLRMRTAEQYNAVGTQYGFMLSVMRDMIELNCPEITEEPKP